MWALTLHGSTLNMLLFNLLRASNGWHVVLWRCMPATVCSPYPQKLCVVSSWTVWHRVTVACPPHRVLAPLPWRAVHRFSQDYSRVFVSDVRLARCCCVVVPHVGSRFEALSIIMDYRPDVVLPPRLPAPDVQSVSSESVSLTWSGPWGSALASPPVQSKTPLTGFRLQYCSCMSGVPSNKWVNVNSVFQECKGAVGGLTPSSPYAFRVAAVNRYGRGAWSSASAPVMTAVVSLPLPASPSFAALLASSGGVPTLGNLSVTTPTPIPAMLDPGLPSLSPSAMTMHHAAIGVPTVPSQLAAAASSAATSPTNPASASSAPIASSASSTTTTFNTRAGVGRTTTTSPPPGPRSFGPLTIGGAVATSASTPTSPTAMRQTTARRRQAASIVGSGVAGGTPPSSRQGAGIVRGGLYWGDRCVAVEATGQAMSAHGGWFTWCCFLGTVAGCGWVLLV